MGNQRLPIELRLASVSLRMWPPDLRTDLATARKARWAKDHRVALAATVVAAS